MLSQYVQLVSHPGDYVSSCQEVDYLQIKHFQLLRGDARFSKPELTLQRCSWSALGLRNRLKLCKTSTLYLEQKCVKYKWEQDLACTTLSIKL